MTERMRITSRQNQRIKDAVRLRTGRERQRSGRMIIDGGREIVRALQAGVHGLEAFLREGPEVSSIGRNAIDLLREKRVEIFDVTDDVFGKLAYGDRDDGVVVIAETPRRGLHDLRLPPAPIIAVLEGIEKPGNVGAIMRSADAAGVHAIVVADGRTDLYNPNTIRASLGTVFRDNVCEATTGETIDWLRGQGIAVVAARLDAEMVYHDFDMRDGAALVLGSEAQGLTDAWQGAGVTPVKLPMLGMADSLNVSTTAAVLFYEALRQRRQIPRL
jgi:RNA methyltransferase, TrmH family